MAVEAVSQVTNREELIAFVRFLINRSDMDTAIASWIPLLEAEVNNYMVGPEPFRHRKMITVNETFNASNANPLIALPSDFIEAVRFDLNDVEMVYKSPAYIDYRRNTVTTLPTAPCEYTYQGGYIEVWPTPTADINGQLEYYAELDPLVGDADTNWLLQLDPSVYCYGVAKHSAPTLRDDARIALWSKMVDDRLTALHSGSKQAAYSGSRLNTPPPVTF